MPDDGAPDARRVLLPFGTGLFAGLAIVCNPHVLAVAGIVLLVVALLASARRARPLAVFALWGLVGCLVVGVLYLWFWVVWFAEVADVMALVPQVLAAWLSGLVQLQTLPAYLHQLVFDRAAFIGTWALVVALVVWRWSGRTVPVAPRLAVLALDAVLLVLACTDGFSTGAGSGFPLLIFVEFALPCYFLFDDMRLVRHPEILLLWVPGILLSLACQFLDGGRDCALYAGFAVSCMGAFATVRDVCMVKDRAAGEEAGATAGTTAGAARFLATGSTAARVLRVFGHACIVLALCAGAASCLLAPAAGAGASSLADNEALSGLSGATFKSDTIPSIAQG